MKYTAKQHAPVIQVYAVASLVVFAVLMALNLVPLAWGLAIVNVGVLWASRSGVI